MPVLREHDSLLRALRRATNADPGLRFESAGEMAEQLTGVLREVLSRADGHPRPGFSTLFSGELQAVGVPAPPEDGDPVAMWAPPATGDIVAGLPVPVVDNADPAAGFLATLSTVGPAQRLAALAAAVGGEQGIPPAVADSPETRCALARALILAGQPDQARPVLATAGGDAADWRAQWYGGLLGLAVGDGRAAQAAFDAVVDLLPGELAPKLALGLAAEMTGESAAAERFLNVVWTLDRSFVTAAFGLARIRLAAGDRGGAVSALSAVPEASSQHAPAQAAAVWIRLLRGQDEEFVAADNLAAAADAVSKLRIDPVQRHGLVGEVLRAALDRILAHQPLSGPVLGCDPAERSLRFGLEDSYRAQARLASDVRRRIALVDLANDVRPRTWT